MILTLEVFFLSFRLGINSLATVVCSSHEQHMHTVATTHLENRQEIAEIHALFKLENRVS